jgi:hypothetical protein
VNRRLTIATFAAAVTLGFAGLVWAAASDHRRTAFSLGVPNNTVIAGLAQGHQLCQGPFTVPRRFAGLELWARPATRFRVEIVAARSGTRLFALDARGSGAPTGSQTVPVRGAGTRPGARILVCVRNLSRARLPIEGGPSNGSSGRAHINGTGASSAISLVTNGVRTSSAMALLFLRSHGPTLLSLLPAVFRRASLFKLSFTGAWTFWVLAAAMLGAFGLAGVALAGASGDEDP